MEGSDIYGKFFSSTFTGSMYGAGATVFAVWGYVIANTVNSNVELNPKMLSATLGATETEVANAIFYLCQPDPGSRNKDRDGRRLIKEGEYQYHVVTHAYYRQMKNEDEKREYNRIKQQESRAKRKLNKGSNEKSNICQSLSPSVTDTEAYTEAKTKSHKTISEREIEEIYQAYPKHEGRADAFRAIRKAVLSNGRDAAWFLERTKAYAQERSNEDPKYTPQPARWFNAARYDDEPVKKMAVTDKVKYTNLEDLP